MRLRYLVPIASLIFSNNSFGTLISSSVAGVAVLFPEVDNDKELVAFAPKIETQPLGFLPLLGDLQTIEAAATISRTLQAGAKNVVPPPPKAGRISTFTLETGIEWYGSSDSDTYVRSPTCSNPCVGEGVIAQDAPRPPTTANVSPSIPQVQNSNGLHDVYAFANTTMDEGTGYTAGTWKIEYELSVGYTYNSRTDDEYLRAAYSERVGSSGLTPESETISVAGQMADLLRILRQTSNATSESNLDLRDAEYAALGYFGGRQVYEGHNRFEGDTNDPTLIPAVASRFGPWGLAVYNAMKTVYAAAPYQTAAPTAPVGGYVPNAAAYIAGTSGISLNSFLNNYQTLKSDIRTLVSARGGKVAETALVPLIKASGLKQDELINLFATTIEKINEWKYFDPPGGGTYSYGVAGNLITHLIIPSEYVAWKDISLSFLGIDVTIQPDQIFDFTLYEPVGIDSFILQGVSTLGDEFVIGLRFASPGDTLLVQLIRNSDSAVNVTSPAPIALLIAGLLFVSFLNTLRYRKRG